MTNPSEGDSVASQIADELKLQAWLGKAEREHPSLRDVSQEASVLAQMRDELRMQAHLGRLELADEWHKTEDRWRAFMGKVSPKADAAVEEMKVLLTEIGDHYKRIREA